MNFLFSDPNEGRIMLECMCFLERESRDQPIKSGFSASKTAYTLRRVAEMAV